MNEARQRIIQSLNDAHAFEQDLEQVLQSQIATAPRGRYRKGLQMHLRETRDHASRIEERLRELGERDNVFQQGVRLLESAFGRGLAMGRAPLGLLRSDGGPEKVLKDARDACAMEAIEMATYAGIAGLAESIGDRQTARMASAIRAEEQKMLDLLLEEMPSLVSWLVDADVRGKAPASISNGAGRAARSSGRKAKRITARAKAAPKRKARPPRKAAGAKRPRRVTSQSPLPIRSYNTLGAEQIVQRLARLSQGELAKIDSYERKHRKRPLILNRIATMQDEWAPSFGQRRVGELSAMRDEADIGAAARIGGREQADRGTVRGAPERDLANA